jgi:hypothetical protein
MKNPMRELARFYARLVLVLAPLTALLAVLTALYIDVALMAGVLVVGGGLVFAYSCGALMARAAARGVDDQLEKFRRGQHLAVWHCSEDEWRRFAEAERQRVGKQEGPIQLLMVGVFAAGGVLVGIGVGMAFGEERGSGGEVIGALLGACLGGLVGAGCGLAYDWVTGRRVRSSARRTYRQALRGGGPTFIGPAGAYSLGEFHGWGDVWGDLLAASFVEGEPACLHLVLGRNGASDTVPEDLFIPVPAGQEEEARKIAARLQGSAPRREPGAPRKRGRKKRRSS